MARTALSSLPEELLTQICESLVGKTWDMSIGAVRATQMVNSLPSPSILWLNHRIRSVALREIRPLYSGTLHADSATSISLNVFSEELGADSLSRILRGSTHTIIVGPRTLTTQHFYGESLREDTPGFWLLPPNLRTVHFSFQHVVESQVWLPDWSLTSDPVRAHTAKAAVRALIGQQLDMIPQSLAVLLRGGRLETLKVHILFINRPRGVDNPMHDHVYCCVTIHSVSSKKKWGLRNNLQFHDPPSNDEDEEAEASGATQSGSAWTSNEDAGSSSPWYLIHRYSLSEPRLFAHDTDFSTVPYMDL